jgi:hypothetical protein
MEETPGFPAKSATQDRICIGLMFGLAVWPNTYGSWQPITKQVGEQPDFTEDLDRFQVDLLASFPSMGIKARRVGSHVKTFEACSTFTRVTACELAESL